MASFDQLNERAFFLPILGFTLLTPPFILLFNHDIELFGVPLLYLYSFLIWLALIVAGKLLADRLSSADKEKINTLDSNKKRMDK